MFKRTLSLILCAVLALCCLAASAAAEAPIEITVAGLHPRMRISSSSKFLKRQAFGSSCPRWTTMPKL